MIYGGAHHSFRDLEKIVRSATKALREHLAEFDSIAVTGVSGISVGAPVALRLRKPLVVVRKPDDNNTHSAYRVEGAEDIGQRVLFFDDLIDSGDTFRRVKRDLSDHGVRRPRVVATYEYDRKQYKLT